MTHTFSRNYKWSKAIGCLMLTAAIGTLGLSGSATFTKAAVTAPNVTTLPQVTGPIPVTKDSHPFTVGGTDLAGHGYRLDEYFISGKANVYDWGANGTATTPEIRTPDAPYTTRMVIRRPTNPSKFSGNVWVELNNPSRGWDVEVEWPTVQEKVMRDGDIWVAVTVKPNVIASLKRIDPKRYAPLSMANPLPPDKQTTGKLPGEPGYDENLSKLYENGLVWDILSQTGALVRSKSTGNPLHSYNVKYVFGTGESQTGFYLNTYAADFAENAKLQNGHTVYDGFVSVSGAGKTVPINQSVAATDVNDPRSQLPSKHVPFMRIDSQGDIFQLGSYLSRRADSDAPGAGYRMYEIAGAPHGPAFIVNYQPLEADILKAGNLPSDVPYAYGGVEPKANTLPRQYIEPAMFANMERWVIKGIRPPHAEPIHVKPGVGTQTTLFGETINASFEKDQYGNVLGGVRSPNVDVPAATYYESATAKQGYPFAWSFGHQDDFSTETLQKLYGTVGTHQNYVAKVEASVKQLENQRWLEPQEGDKIIQQAELTPIP
jgi:hypothetical protein